ncbi:MAG: DNA lyase [Desulfuromonadales bacterium]|nr:DNA lyase [Desulfuromonadales bacterium]
MRLWTVHPQYLDPQGLVALWREALLAQRVLEGKTRGYRNHPQLLRFRSAPDPLAAIATFLQAIAAEALVRRYAFDSSRILAAPTTDTIEETEGQLLFEWQHLRAKLAQRTPLWYRRAEQCERPEANPLFTILPGPVRPWEKGVATGK